MQSYLQRFAGSKRSWLPEPDPDDAELSAKRRRNDERHKSRWSSIIDRYSKDFSQVGDEIDLRTGRIVVNNGHVARMRDEFDNGDAATKSPHQRSDVLSRMVTGYVSDLEDGVEDSDLSEDGLILEGATDGIDEEGAEYGDESNGEDEDGEEDELNSDWPVPSPQRPRRQPPETHKESTSPSTEEHFEDAQQILEDDDETSRTQQPATTVEYTQPVAADQPPPSLPQFQMPQLGLGEQMETAMQAMSTAMGAAIQAQMMAFMNVVLATRGDTAASPNMPVPNAATITSLFASNSNAPQQPTNAHSLQQNLPHQDASRHTNKRRREISNDSGQRSRRTGATPSNSDLTRAQTPGFGSLWAVPHKRKAGRPKNSSLLKPNAAARVTVPRPALEESEPEYLANSPLVDIENEQNGRSSSEALRRQETSSSPLPAASRSYGTTSTSYVTPSVANGTGERSDRTHLRFGGKEKAFGKSHSKRTEEAQSSKDMPFIVDSDEDEISTITPSSSARKRDSASANNLLQHTGATQPIASPSVLRTQQRRSSLSRAGLRNRKSGVSYDEKATFTGLLGNMDSESDENSTVQHEPRRNLKQNKSPPMNRSDDDLQTRPGYDLLSGLWQEATLPPDDISHDRSVPTIPEQSRHAANVAVPRTRIKPHPVPTAREASVAMGRKELEARYAALSFRDRRNELKYEDRPPPHPCAHCKTTASTSFLHNPEGGLERICNACFSWWKKHNGEKRPVTLEEFRSLKDKLPCDNCTKIAVSDWDVQIKGKRLCKQCARYAKLHNGTMMPVKRPTLVECERCHTKVIKIWMLSNRAKVCIDCHNEIFADYDPEDEMSDMEMMLDIGEIFFDRCLLIYAYNFLLSAPVGRRSAKNLANASGMPCKVCHVMTAAGWRPGLNGSLICEICYVRTTKMINEHKLQDQYSEDGTLFIRSAKTTDFACTKCKELILGTKWRGTAEHGVIVCTSCCTESHGAHQRSTPAEKVAKEPVAIEARAFEEDSFSEGETVSEDALDAEEEAVSEEPAGNVTTRTLDEAPTLAGASLIEKDSPVEEIPLVEEDPIYAGDSTIEDEDEDEDETEELEGDDESPAERETAHVLHVVAIDEL